MEKIGFLNELGVLYQLTATVPQKIYFSYDDSASWGILEYPYKVPMSSFSYGAGILVGLSKGCTTQTKNSIRKTDYGGIITIPAANITVTTCDTR